tara:strand:+ start:252 stop:455 length:204 start_codon:yes stop_codon:yes gene_type:complete
MFFLAWIGTFSGMVIMSLNYPFIIHTVSYCFSGIFLAVIFTYEKKILTKLQKWSKNIGSHGGNSLLN